MTTASRQKRPGTGRPTVPLPPEFTTRDAGPFDPPSALTRLGEDGPVHRVTMLDGDPAWIVTSHELARTLLGDPRMSSDRFRSRRVLEKLPAPVRARMTDARARAGSFITMDPPEHTRYRKLLTGQFTVRRMRQLEPRIQRIVDDHLDAMIAAGPGADLVQAFALPVPSLVICELLGVGYGDRGEFQERTGKLLKLDVPVDEVMRLAEELRAFMQGLVRSKRAEPTDDMLSGLIQADPTLTDDELIGMANLLLVAGHETTANMLALGTFALLEHPEQLAALRAEPSSVGGAVEELLRYLSIVHLGVVRTTREEVEIAGEVVPADSTVLVSVPAGNRDPYQYPRPDVLDVTRPRGPHLAFGHGVHQCLGQQLARVEMTVGFTGLLTRLPGLRLAVPAAEVPMRDDMLVYGVHALPITWDA
ncbi:cytochrome P450 [Saccharothrix saharensis]|uniref:Cytochrome P450 n=1 Tax=Saccharothrix saharensis TaxID=571190 RepID=A0A543J6J3_9PSEU|nr:cytochrome P450 [Saccharothrix saharensis]TQM78460.1 cytochrome P450 [Saccharothrix saharensis]